MENVIDLHSQKELSFTVCLHYKYTNLDEELMEEKKVSIGKPLVSKLNLHEARPLQCFSASSSSDLQMSSMLESLSFSEGLSANLADTDFSSIGSESTSWSYYQRPMESPTKCEFKNEPEESISPEFLECEDPPATKSLPSGASKELPFKFSNLTNSI